MRTPASGRLAHLTVAVALALALISPQAAQAVAPRLPAADVTALLSEVARDPAAATAYSTLLAAIPFLDALAPANQERALSEIVRAARRRAPLVSARAELERLGSTAAPGSRAARVAALGLVTRWLALGPDASEDAEEAQAALLASGVAPREGARVELGGGVARWRRLDDTGPPGLTSVAALLAADHPGVAHLAATIELPRAERIVLRLGAAGSVAVAVDGIPRGAASGLEAAALDQLELALDLDAGPHALLVSVAPGAAAPLVVVRLTDARGAASEASSRPEVLAWGEGLPAPRAAASSLRRSRATTGADLPRSRGILSRIRRAMARRSVGLPDRGDPGEGLLEELLLAPEVATLPARAVLLALAGVAREEAQASVLLHLHGAKGAREEPILTAALAQLAVRSGQVTRARELFASAQAALAPDLARVLGSEIERYDARAEVGWRRIEARAQAADAPEAVLREAARAAVEAGLRDRAEALLRRLAGALPGRVEHRAAHAQALVSLGRGADAVDAYAILADERPDAPGYRLEAARLALVVGQGERARALLEAALLTAGERPDIYEAVGAQWEELGDLARAESAYERALALRPASPSVRARLERLAGAAPAPWSTGRADEALLATPPLDPDAPVEVLAEERVFDVRADGSVTRWVRRVIRVQRVPDDRDGRVVSIEFDPSREDVRVLEARVLRDGLARAVPERELRSLSEAWYGLYYDLRELRVPFDDLRAGDVVEMSWRVDATGQLFAGVVGLVEPLTERAPKHRLRVELRAPRALRLVTRLHEPRAAGDAGRARLRATHEELDGGRERWVVEGDDLPGRVAEPLMPGAAEVGPVWEVTSFHDFEALVRFYGALVAGQKVVTPAMRAFVARAVADASPRGVTSETAVLQRLSEAVTRDVRYVGLEFGVHGYKPYRTDEIWGRRFGDCKDQASLLVALLELAGIEARVALVRTRPRGRVADALPNLAHFDHAIVFVPDRGLWIDPTAQSYGVGELPWSDQGAQVLVIDPSAGARAALVETPVDRPEQGGVAGAYSVALQESGAAGLAGTVTFRGAQAPRYRALLADPDTRERNVEELLNGRYPGLKLLSATSSDPADHTRPVALTFNAEVPQLASRVGATLQVPRPAGGDGHAQRLASTARRVQPLVLGPPTRTALVFHYVLPLGFAAPFLPPTAARASPFGRFSVTWEAHAGTATVSTELVWTVDQVAAADYPAFREFVLAWDEATRPPLVLERQAAPAAETAPTAAVGR